MTTGDPGATSLASAGARRIAGWSTAGFVLLVAGWVLVMPPATGIDEFDHAFRASSVSLGHWQPGVVREPTELARGAFIPVREDIVQAAEPACARLKYTKKFNCQPLRRVSPHVVEVASGTDNYNPSFYAVVGTFARPWSGNASLYAMRIAASALCAAVFAFSVYLTMRWARTRWPLVALLLACLPTTMYSASLAAPNALNMMSGLLIWTSLAALWTGRPDLRGAAYAALSVGGALLVNTHTLGIFWAALFAFGVVVHAGPRRAIELLRPRTWRELAAFSFVALAVAFQLFWIVYAGPNQRAEGGVAGSPWTHMLASIVVWPLQAVGAFPLRNEPAPLLLYAIAVVVIGIFAVLAIRAAATDRALLRTGAVILFWSVAVPIGLTYVTYHQNGLTWQGRYGMPYTVGLFVIAAIALDRVRPRLSPPIIVVGTLTWGLAQVIGQVHVLREQRSDTHLVAATGWWAPPAAFIIVLGLAATAAWLGALSRRPSVSTLPLAQQLVR